jgi:uncharacterized protein (DUF4415 family)
MRWFCVILIQLKFCNAASCDLSCESLHCIRGGSRSGFLIARKSLVEALVQCNVTGNAIAPSSRNANSQPYCLKESDMADQPRRPRTLNDARSEAEAAFKKATTKVAAAPQKQVVVPGVREQVTLRIDQDVLEYFQSGGPGWQDRINDALRKAAGK